MALIPPIVALLLQTILWRFIHPHVWFLFYPAVFLSSWVGGLRAGIVATAISIASVLWFFVPPEESFFVSPAEYFPTSVFLVTGVLFGIFHDRLRNANRKIADALVESDRANQDLRKAVKERRVFAAFAENSSDFIGIADADGKPVYLNPAGRRMVGLSPDYPIENTQIPEYYARDQREFAVKVIMKSMIEKGLWQGETCFRNWQTEDAIPVSDTHFMIREPETGEILGMATVTRDISDIRRAREELERVNEEVMRLYEKGKELDTLKTQLFSGVSHELRTPLALILGPTERLLQAPDTSDSARRDLEIIDRNARTLLAHVNDLLDVAKLEAGGMTPEYVETDVARLVHFVAGHFEALSKEKEIEFRVEGPDAVLAQIDADKVKRIIFNLLSNAFKFTPSGGRVRLTFREAPERIAFEVSDSGPGIPPDQREAVFERFRQIGGAAQPSGGTGLGLSIAQEFTLLHGGSISISDAAEGGARFVVDLPRLAPSGTAVRRKVDGMDEARARSEASRVPRAVEVERSTVRAEGPLVLVVEDNLEMNRFIAEELAREYRVEVAFDGKEGLEKARTLKPDLVLSDIMMPVMSGDELVRELRRSPEFESTPIVLLTAKSDDALRVRLLREGAQDYLTKPFSIEELRARVANHVARKLAEEQSRALRQQVETVAQAGLSVSEAVAGLPETSVRAVLQTIAVNAQSLTAAEFAAAGIGGDSEHPFGTWASVGMSDEQAANIGRQPRPVGVLGLVSRENRGIRLRDLREHPEYRGLPPNHPVMTSFLGVPIRYRGHPVGNLYLANKRGAAGFTEQDQRLIEMLAVRAGVAIETARLYAREGMERAWLQAVIDQMPEGVVLMDARGRVTMKNKSVLALASAQGSERDRFGNEGMLALRRPSGEPLRPDEIPLVRAVTDEKTVPAHELVAQRVDGSLMPLLVSAAPIRAVNGDLVGATMVLQDVSALKELENLREEWASIVAHDLQQPINAILLRTDLMLRAAADDRQGEDVRQIRKAATRLGRMVNDLMDASQLETHRMRITLERLDFGELVREIVDRLPEAAGRTRIRAPSGALFVRGDAQRLEQILTNLLSNAFKYGAPDTEVDLEIEERDGEAEVSVMNRGQGIPADELPFLFERYARSRAARKSSTKGTGLGLYIAKGLVEAQGGRIWADSTPGEATTFHFTIALDGPAAPMTNRSPRPQNLRPEA